MVAPEKFTCTPGAEAPSLPLPRLSRTQYVGAVRAAVVRAVPAEASAIISGLQGRLALIPADSKASPTNRHAGFSRIDQTVTQAHADAYYDVAVALGQELTRTPARRQALLGACATDAVTTNDDACFTTFLRSFGARVLRSPLSADDETFFRAFLAGAGPVSAEGLADVVGGLFADPRFAYRVEGGAGGTATAAPLTAYELASRLSFYFWQEPPDDALWAAAVNGTLLTDATYRAQVTRHFDDARALTTVDEFVGQWLHLDTVPSVEANLARADYLALAGADRPVAGSTDAIRQEVLDMGRWVTRQGGTLSDLLTDTHSFARDAWLAKIYGVAPWNGTATPPVFPNSVRGGLLGRAAFVVSGSANTRPILKGVRLRTAVLCDTLGDPPPNATDTPPPSHLPANATTRQKVAALTEVSPGCAACHSTLINPLGFVSEGFDGLGRPRSVETIYSAGGAVVGTAPVDTRVRPHVVLGDTRELTSVAELGARVSESKRFESCAAQQYFRFAFQRFENLDTDSCALSRLETQARSTSSLSDFFKSVALAPEFKRRTY